MLTGPEFLGSRKIFPFPGKQFPEREFSGSLLQRKPSQTQHVYTSFITTLEYTFAPQANHDDVDDVAADNDNEYR